MFLTPLRGSDNVSFFFCPGGVTALVFTTNPHPRPSSLPLSLSSHPTHDGWNPTPPLTHPSCGRHCHPPQANFTLPEVCDFLEEVTFVEVQRDEAESLLKQYNEEGRKAGPPPEKRFDNRQGGFRGRGGGGGGGYQRYDNRDGPRGGYQSRSGDGGSGYRGGD